MSKGVNLASQEFRNNIIQTINTCGLPPVLVKYILADILKEIMALEDKTINDEKKALEEEKEREG